MALLVVRLRTDDVQKLRQNFSERLALKAVFGCTSSRLLVEYFEDVPAADATAGLSDAAAVSPIVM